MAFVEQIVTCQAEAEMVKVTDNLKVLNLRRNNIGDDGAKARCAICISLIHHLPTNNLNLLIFIVWVQGTCLCVILRVVAPWMKLIDVVRVCTCLWKIYKDKHYGISVVAERIWVV